MSYAYRALVCALFSGIALAGAPAQAQDSAWTAKMADQEPPKELAEPIRAALDAKPLQLLKGDASRLWIWFRKDIPFAKKPEKPEEALKALKETTLLGVLKVESDWRDFRDDLVKPDLYTLRFALQPQNGDHMGTAPVPFFAVLTPIEQDKALDTFANVEALLNTAKGKSHPRSISLRPAEKTDGDFPRVEDGFDETKIVCVKLPARAEGVAEPIPLILGLVVEGHGVIQ